MSRRHRLIARLSAVAAVPIAVVVFLLPASPASAVTCSESSHCYVMYEWDSPPALGNVSGHVSYSVIGAVSGSRTNQEAWISLPGGSPYQYSIEQGIKWGLGPDGHYYSGLWFWEDNRPGSHPYFHPTSLPISGDIPWGFHYHGSSEWILQRGDVTPANYGTSTSAPGPTYAVETGTEFTNISNDSCGQQVVLAYDLSGSYTEHFAWDTATDHSVYGWTSGSGLWDASAYENFYFSNHC